MKTDQETLDSIIEELTNDVVTYRRGYGATYKKFATREEKALALIILLLDDIRHELKDGWEGGRH
jgi:hypothetical protein